MPGGHDRPTAIVSTASALAWLLGAVLAVYSLLLATTGRPTLPWSAVSLGLLLAGAGLGALESRVSDREG